MNFLENRPNPWISLFLIVKKSGKGKLKKIGKGKLKKIGKGKGKGKDKGKGKGNGGV